MPVDDASYYGNEERRQKKLTERMQVHASSGLQVQYITRTNFDALVTSGLQNYGVLYAVNEAL